MSPRWIAIAFVAAGVFVVVTGLLDDLIRVAIWELLAAAGALLWYDTDHHVGVLFGHRRRIGRVRPGAMF